MKIPVFVSSPTNLSPSQEAARTVIIGQLDDNDLEPRALGRSDYPTELPLREIFLIARHWSGGVILGFEQFRADSGVSKPGASAERRVSTPTRFPTPWNHLESGILFGLRLPILVFREDGITGGVFDNGVSDVFVHPIPSPDIEGLPKRHCDKYFRDGQARFANITIMTKAPNWVIKKVHFSDDITTASNSALTSPRKSDARQSALH